jgi:hypothetical protein
VQTAGNHQVKDQPKIFIDSNRDALADASQFPHDVTFHTSEGWLRSAKQKCARQAHVVEWLTDNTWFQRADIGGNIW